MNFSVSNVRNDSNDLVFKKDFIVLYFIFYLLSMLEMVVFWWKP